MKPFILKISFTISILGILILLLLVNILEPKPTKINQLKIKHLKKQVSLIGKITNIKNYENFQIITITNNTEKIDLIINKITNFQKDQKIITKGILEEYKGNFQIRVLTIKQIFPKQKITKSSTSHSPAQFSHPK